MKKYSFIESLTCKPALPRWRELLLDSETTTPFSKFKAQLRAELGLGDSSVIATGHQPEIPHFGIFAKYLALAEVSDEFKKLHIILDIDFCENYSLKYFSAERPFSNKRLFFSSEEKPYSEISLPSKDTLLEQQKLILISLENASGEAENEPLLKNFDLLLEFADRKVVDWFAELISRSTRSKTIQAVKFSALIKLPPSKEFFIQALSQVVRLFETYNNTLELHRKERNISNPANPFPNLSIGDGFYEMPFWLFNSETSSREILRLNASGLVQNDCSWQGKHVSELIFGNSNLLLAPRGAFVSVFFRLIVSDFFIHGLGGEHYERFTDKFIEAYWKVEPPNMAVVSCDAFLFSKARADLASLKALDDLERGALKNSAALKAIASQDEIKEIDKTLEERAIFIEKLKNKTEINESKNALNRINKSFAELTRQIIKREKENYSRHLESEKDTLLNRAFPFFYFPSSAKEELLELLKQDAA
jgi:hypothetical protein